MPEKARPEYQIAAQGGVADAYSNLGRLEIFEKKYSVAVALLSAGLKLVKTKTDRKAVKTVEYRLNRNLGWARLKQQRYKEAQDALQRAIQIDSNLSPAYCLMAQVKEQSIPSSSWMKFKEKAEAREYWEKCLKLARKELDEYSTSIKKPVFPMDQDYWKAQAEKCLQSSFSEKPCLEEK